jgi:uncharacterized protein YigA (DUF484 family)
VEQVTILDLVDNILASNSSYQLQKRVKLIFKEIFQCERVQVLLINRHHKFFYKIKKDKKTGSEEMKKFSLDKGLVGTAVATGETIYSEHTQLDVRFVKSVDDPKGTGISLAH